VSAAAKSLTLVAGTLLCTAAMGLLPAAAQANAPITSYSVIPSTTQAGGHPDLGVQFSVLNRLSQRSQSACNCEDAKDVTVHLPAGFIGNPQAAPQCSIADFSADICPIDSQIGIVQVYFANTHSSFGVFVSAVYNVTPPPNVPGMISFKTPFDTPQFEIVSSRTGGDYGLDVKVTSIYHGLGVPLDSFLQDIWGVPADPSHDPLRLPLAANPSLLGDALCDANGSESTADPSTIVKLCYPANCACSPSNASNSPLTPFFQNPTNCDGPFSTSLDVLSYDGGSDYAEFPWPQMTGCDQLSFNPSQAIAPTTTAADSPSGADFQLNVPQFESPTVPSPSEIRATTVTLPPGFSIAPNVTNGKVTCSDAQAKFGTTEEAECPEDSKIGSISVETPVLPGPLTGYVYLGEPKPGNRYRMFLVFDGFATHIKLPGTITPDPQTGQIVISFENLPQTPFARFTMHVFGSERGPLDTPTQCGTYEVQSVFTPWDSALPTETSRQFFEVNEGPNGTPCPNGARPFHPGFQAASAANTAASHTAFSLNLNREDGEQNLGSLKVTTPPGFSATLKGVSYCPQASIAAAEAETLTGTEELAHPSCPASSQVGELTAGAGPGSHPLYLPGKVYLAGPYQGAPLSFVFIVPAVSGGYDLGNVVVREGLEINPETAQVTTAGAALPQIFQGIPLRLRQIFVNLNRPNFALNPTNCNPLAVTAEVFGSEGAISNLSNHFQVANCASLGFNPKLSLRLSGSSKRLGNPALAATLTYPGGSDFANLSSTEVVLPPTELLDNAHIQAPCTLKQFAQKACPPGTIIGFAKAETPLLEKPLEGPVYLRNGSHKLPDIVAALNGQIGEIDLVGHVDSIHARLRARFETVPDAPVSRFTLDLYGGQKGLTENTEDLCSRPQIAAVTLDAQNGKSIAANQSIQLPCSPKHQKRVRHERSKKHRAKHHRKGTVHP